MTRCSCLSSPTVHDAVTSIPVMAARTPRVEGASYAGPCQELYFSLTTVGDDAIATSTRTKVGMGGRNGVETEEKTVGHTAMGRSKPLAQQCRSHDVERAPEPFRSRTAR